MADNILKNEFMWEKKQEKKKLYKNWKLYAIALGITVIGAGTGLGVYYGVFANHSEVTKIDLNTLNQNAIDSTSSNMTKEEAFNAFKENNKGKDLDFNKFDVTITKQPGYGSDNGSFTITAKTNTKYNGTITITINGLQSTALNTLNQNAINSTSLNITKEEAFNAFKENNKDKDLDFNKFDVTITKQPGYGNDNGSFTITAKTNTEYNGTITITINGLQSTALNTLNQNAIDGKENMTAEDAFNAFKENNKDKDLNFNNFDVTITKQPGYDTDNGSFTITAKTNTEYNGTITITINGILDIKNAIDKIRQIHSEGIAKHSEDEWKNAWFAYFDLMKKYIKNITFYFTNQDLQNDTNILNSLTRQLEEYNSTVLGDLKNLYSINKLIATTKKSEESSTISFNNGSINMLLSNLDNSGTSSIIEVFSDITIHYIKILN